MKVFALGTLTQPLTPEQQQQIMPQEVPDTLRLYLDGKIEQFWFRQDKPAVIFLVNAESVAQAQETLSALPLTAAGLMTFELIPVGPLAPPRPAAPGQVSTAGRVGEFLYPRNSPYSLRQRSIHTGLSVHCHWDGYSAHINH